MSSKVLLLYGYGANVGAGVVKKFASNGWKTAAIVRTLKDEYKNSADVVLQADFSDYKSIQNVYSEVESKLGTPTCVVYNAYSIQAAVQSAEDIFSVPVDKVATDIAVNTTSFYAAASLAHAGFTKLSPSPDPKVFIFTGNGLPTLVSPEVAVLGASKAASGHLIEAASHALGKSSHWYFADERLPNGKPIMNALSGEAHADAFYSMATAAEQGPWNYTFVKGKGYQRFPDVQDHDYKTVKELLEYVHG